MRKRNFPFTITSYVIRYTTRETEPVNIRDQPEMKKNVCNIHLYSAPWQPKHNRISMACHIAMQLSLFIKRKKNGVPKEYNRL